MQSFPSVFELWWGGWWRWRDKKKAGRRCGGAEKGNNLVLKSKNPAEFPRHDPIEQTLNFYTPSNYPEFLFLKQRGGGTPSAEFKAKRGKKQEFRIFGDELGRYCIVSTLQLRGKTGATTFSKMIGQFESVKQ